MSDIAAAKADGDLLSDSSWLRGPEAVCWLLSVSIAFALFLAALIPIDEGVPVTGAVEIDTKRKEIQHQHGGIVREVLVREGQYVKAGAPLLLLDEAQMRANHEAVRQNYLTLRAMEGRLRAEQTGKASISFHPDLMDDTLNYVRQIRSTQESLFRSRQAAMHAEHQGMEASIRGTLASIAGYEGMIRQRQHQLALVNEELAGLRNLVAEGYAPRNKQFTLERQGNELLGNISSLQAKAQESKASVAEMRQRSAAHEEKYRSEVNSELTKVLREVQADAEKLKAASDDLARTTIRSPVDGQVVGLAIQSRGGTVGAGQKIMDIVPRDERLLFEAKLPAHAAHRVSPGAKADVRFLAYAQSPELVVEGRVDTVSTDLIQGQPPNSPSYYLARIAITSSGAIALGNRQLQGGMPVEIVIKTGDRTLLAYLFRPITKHG